MRIGIIGGGFTGLTAAHELLKHGHSVSVFEKEKYLGGLAYGFKAANWNWYLEGAYHHLFTNDTAILALIRDIGIEEKIIIKRPITSTYYKGTAHQFDSPMHLLTFPDLSMADKIRTGILAAVCKIYPFWQTLESITAKEFAIAIGGQAGWQTIWEPLMRGKFGEYESRIAASWLWARIHKRTPSLGYISGGFHTCITKLADTIQNAGGTIHTDTHVQSVRPQQKTIEVRYGDKKALFDRVLITVPTPIALRLLPQLADSYTKPLVSIPHLHAQVLILETEKPILQDVYWLNVNDRTFPFLAVVAHTNFMDKKHYGGKHITYVGNYLPTGHRYLSMDKKQILKEFNPFLQRINPRYNLLPAAYYLFNGPFAQPVHMLHYSGIAPKLPTPVPGIYLANMDSIYPWDRGTNYAVELGQRAATVMSSRA